MEQGNYPFLQVPLYGIKPDGQDKAVVHVGDVMIPTSLWVSQLDAEADNQHKTLKKQF